MINRQIDLNLDVLAPLIWALIQSHYAIARLGTNNRAIIPISFPSPQML
jgi:hypothetical protein